MNVEERQEQLTTDCLLPSPSVVNVAMETSPEFRAWQTQVSVWVSERERERVRLKIKCPFTVANSMNHLDMIVAAMFR